MAFLAYRKLREWLWRLGVPLPARKGWEREVREVTRATRAGGVWCSGDIAGVPLEWSLLERDARGKVVPTQGKCLATGVMVSGSFPVDQEGIPDLSNYGVRCARCSAPLHCLQAGMVNSNDVSSCRVCRPLVRLVQLLTF